MSQVNNQQLAPDQQEGAVYHLCYVSAETASFSQDELVSLLTDARRVNAERGVTGLLLYREGCFYQVLEGSESAVRQTFEHIQSDPRHKEVRVLFNGDTEAREFADWQMGFLNLDGVDIETLTWIFRLSDARRPTSGISRKSEPRQTTRDDVQGAGVARDRN